MTRTGPVSVVRACVEVAAVHAFSGLAVVFILGSAQCCLLGLAWSTGPNPLDTGDVIVLDWRALTALGATAVSVPLAALVSLAVFALLARTSALRNWRVIPYPTQLLVSLVGLAPTTMVLSAIANFIIWPIAWPELVLVAWLHVAWVAATSGVVAAEARWRD